MKLKKFFSLLMVAALCVGFTACSDDDDDNPDTIVGTWQYSSLELKVETSNAIVTEIIKTAVGAQLADVEIPNFTLVLTDNGKYTLSAAGQTSNEGTYTYANNKLVLTGDLSMLDFPGVENSLAFDVSFNSGKLILELDMEPLLGEIFAEYSALINKLAIAITLSPVYTN